MRELPVLSLPGQNNLKTVAVLNKQFFLYRLETNYVTVKRLILSKCIVWFIGV